MDAQKLSAYLSKLAELAEGFRKLTVDFVEIRGMVGSFGYLFTILKVVP